MTTIDQNIWIERIKKEQAERQKFNLVSLVNAHSGSQCSNYGVARTYLRDGQAPDVVKNRPFYMLDSTYTVASNPNTMRDTGPLRNAQYRVADPADFEYLKKSRRSVNQKQTMADEKEMRQTLTARCTHQRPTSQMQNAHRSSGAFSFAQSQQASPTKKMNVIDPFALAAIGGYTKNISELVFSPAILRKRPETAQKGLAHVKKQLKGNFIEKVKYREIESELKSEKARRSKLTDDVRKIREQLDTIQKSVISGKQ